MARLVPDPEIPLRRAAQVRVIYGDTDRMGVVYHGTYFRYLEHARVEFIRSLGVTYSAMERQGFGLPVTDLMVTYLAPARYDDLVTLNVGLAKLTWARIHFQYRLVVEPGDRYELDEPIEILRGETRHGCVSLEDGRATRLPDEIHEFLERYQIGED
jgi:acyl-CoA thioester hydrolase